MNYELFLALKLAALSFVIYTALVNPAAWWLVTMVIIICIINMYIEVKEYYKENPAKKNPHKETT